MDYTLDDVIEKVNKMGKDVGLPTGLEIEDGEDLYSFIIFLDNTLADLIKENKELTKEITRLKYGGD